jgi:hypothetical protein
VEPDHRDDGQYLDDVVLLDIDQAEGSIEEQLDLVERRCDKSSASAKLIAPPLSLLRSAALIRVERGRFHDAESDKIGRGAEEPNETQLSSQP